MNSPKWMLLMSVPRGKSQLPPASLGGSTRSTSESDPGSFQTTASAPGLEILHVPFKWIHCFLQAFNSPKRLPHWPSVRPSRGCLSSWCRIPSLGSPVWDSDLSFLGGDLCSCDYTLLCGLPAWGCEY